MFSFRIKHFFFIILILTENNDHYNEADGVTAPYGETWSGFISEKHTPASLVLETSTPSSSRGELVRLPGEGHFDL